jgi:hypothetical protein
MLVSGNPKKKTTEMESKIFGDLIETDYDSDWLETSLLEIPYFSNKKLKITLVEKDSEYIQNAEIAFQNFLKLTEANKNNDSEKVYNYYAEILKAGYTKNLNLKTKSEIWDFVTARQIVLHWSEDGTIYLCVSCECEWEIEHGLQLSFKNGEKLVKANSHSDDFEE